MSLDYRGYDDNLFPAYANYIDGVNTPYYEAPESGLEPLLYPGAGPIPYTNSMPSKSMLYRRAQISLPPHHGPIEPAFGDLPYPGIQDGPSVLDLRLPLQYPELVTLIPPETLHFAPQPQPSRAPALFATASVKHEPAVSSAEITRRKLLGASLQHSGSIASPVLLTPQPLPRTFGEQIGPNSTAEKRRMPARQATHPSLLRSSSATDIDSQAGTMPPSRRPVLSQADSSTPVRPQDQPPSQQLQQNSPGWLPDQLSPASQLAALQLPPTPLIKPGELLSNPRDAAAPEANFRRMDAQITSLYNTALKHPHPESRKLALTHIATASTKVHNMVHDREQTLWKRQLEPEAQRQVQAQAQNSRVRSAVTRLSYVQPQDFPDGFEQPTMSPQHQPRLPVQRYLQQMPFQAPIQQLPQHNTTPAPETLPPHTPPSVPADLGGIIDGQVPKYVYANRLIATFRTDAKGIADRSAAQNWQKEFRARLPPAGRQYLDDKVAKMTACQNVANQLHQPVQAPQLQQHAQHYPEQILPSRQVPVIPIAEPLRLRINAELPRFFAAMNACSMPATAENAELQRQALNFQENFKANLPPEGHAYIEEIVHRMSIERCEGRDMMTAMPT
jgi:hypothetical protein